MLKYFRVRCDTLSYFRINTPISRSDKIKLKVRRNKSRNNPGAGLSAIGTVEGLLEGTLIRCVKRGYYEGVLRGRLRGCVKRACYYCIFIGT